jgi:uncharacterized protein (TIGR01568 family)
LLWAERMTQRGAGGALPPTKKKKKSAALGFMCGCGGSKSVSTVSHAAVAAANISAPATTTPMKNTATASAAKRTIAGKTKVMQDAREDDEEESASAEGTPSADALLQELRELEQGVRALGVREQDDAGGGTNGNAPRTRPRHRRSATDWGGGGRLEAESVAVVTESADPLGDFRRSMVQMILENGITGGAELRELLQRFLSLNPPRHHHLILRAFADVWEEIFAGGGSLVLRQ